MQESNHVNTGSLLTTKDEFKKHYSYVINTLKNAILLTFCTFAFILIIGMFTSIFIFACSSIALQVMFDSLPIILMMVFISSIFNSVRDNKKRTVKKKEKL